MGNKVVIDIDKINKIIEEKNISISKIAAVTGYSRITIWRYLTKRREPKISFINNISKIL